MHHYITNMSDSLLPLTMQASTDNLEYINETENESNTGNPLNFEYNYDFWNNESYDSDFLVSCAVTMAIFIYANFADYIAKKYIH